VIPADYETEMMIPDPKISIFFIYILILIHVAFTVDHDPEVSDPDPMGCDPWSRVPCPDPGQNYLRGPELTWKIYPSMSINIISLTLL